MPIRPLLNRCPLEPDESLPSLLARLQVANYYASPRAMADICRPHLPSGENLHLPHLAETWPVLSEVTRLPPADLYHASFHPYATALALPWETVSHVSLPDGEQVPLLSARMRRLFLRPLQDAQYCPACLADGRYHRRQWWNLLAAICPQHACLLQRGCPHCQQKLPVAAIVTGQCPSCAGDLTAAPFVSVSHDNWGLWVHRQLHAWWGDTPASALPNQVTIPNQTTSVLLEVLRGLVTAAAKLPEEQLHMIPHVVHLSSHPHELPPPVRVYQTYATVMKALVNWPQGFHDFLATYRQRPGVAIGQVTVEFDPLYRNLLEEKWQRPEFTFIQDAFDDFLVANYPVSRSVTSLDRYQRSQELRDRFPYLTQAEAAERLGIELETAQRLVEVGMLVDYERGEGQQRHWHQRLRIVRRTEFVDLQKRWQMGVPLADVARILDVDNRVIENLLDAALLTQDNAPVGHVEKVSLNAFGRRLHRYPVIPCNFGKPVTLWELVEAGYDLVRVLQQVLAGKVMAVWLGGSLYSLWLSQDEVHLLKQ
jgi:hypothetical protein